MIKITMPCPNCAECAPLYNCPLHDSETFIFDDHQYYNKCRPACIQTGMQPFCPAHIKYIKEK